MSISNDSDKHMRMILRISIITAMIMIILVIRIATARRTTFHINIVRKVQPQASSKPRFRSSCSLHCSSVLVPYRILRYPKYKIR